MLNRVREKTKHLHVIYNSDHLNVDERNRKSHEMEQNSGSDVDLSLCLKKHLILIRVKSDLVFSEPWPDLFFWTEPQPIKTIISP
jgi:hypothetical protein